MKWTEEDTRAVVERAEWVLLEPQIARLNDAITHVLATRTPTERTATAVLAVAETGEWFVHGGSDQSEAQNRLVVNDVVSDMICMAEREHPVSVTYHTVRFPLPAVVREDIEGEVTT